MHIDDLGDGSGVSCGVGGVCHGCHLAPRRVAVTITHWVIVDGDRVTSQVMVPGRNRSYSGAMARPPVGELLRDWRTRRRRSQLDLALDVGVSTRHLSFVETGRSRPSVELVLALAHHLDVPLRERNGLLLAAGYAPRFSQMSLDDPAMANVRASIQRMLDAHDPYPGAVIDRQWNVAMVNRAGLMLAQGIPDHLLGPPMNVYRLCLHPDGLARRTTNFTDWATYLLEQLRRSIVLTGDPTLVALLDEVSNYPNVVQIAPLVDASWSRRAADPRPVSIVDSARPALLVHHADNVRHAARRHDRRTGNRAVLPRGRRQRPDAASPGTEPRRVIAPSDRYRALFSMNKVTDPQDRNDRRGYDRRQPAGA